MKNDNTYVSVEIIQLVSAPPGWRVVYKEADGSFFTLPIACFALTRNDVREKGTGRLIKQGGDEGFDVHPIAGADYLEVDTNYRAVIGPGQGWSDSGGESKIAVIPDGSIEVKNKGHSKNGE